MSARPRAVANALGCASLSLFAVACSSSCDKVDRDGLVDAAAAEATDASVARGPRCEAKGASRPLPAVTEVGQAVAIGTRVAIGVIFSANGADAGARAHQGVVITDDTLSKIDVRDLGEAAADAPPPKPLFGGGELFVAFHPRASRGSDAGAPADARASTLRVQRLDGDPAAFDVARASSASMAFDVAYAKGAVVVAWEEDRDRRGVIRLSRAGKPSVVVSPEGRNADDPKLLTMPDGRVAVAWTAQRDEPLDGGREDRPEGPSLDRQFSWAEVAFIDPDRLDVDAGIGAPDAGPRTAFPTHRVTPENGHVVAMELSLSHGNAVAWIQDEGAESDGAGGRILSTTLAPGASPTRDPRVVVSRDVGHALFDYLPINEESAFISFADAAERQWLATAASSGATDAHPTLEPTMELGRPLLAIGASPANGSTSPRVLALKAPGAAQTASLDATPLAELSWLTCAL